MMHRIKCGFVLLGFLTLGINTSWSCDYYVMISSSNHGTGPNQLCIDPGQSVPLFALHTYNFITYFDDPIRQLVWTCNGNPIDTTNYANSIYDGSLYYITTLYVNQPGIYEVVYTTPNNQTMILNQVIITWCPDGTPALPMETSGIPEDNKFDTESWKVYPNPSTTGTVYISNPENRSETSLTISDASGVQVFATTMVGNEVITFNTQEYKPGIYFISISSNEGVIRKKVIVN